MTTTERAEFVQGYLLCALWLADENPGPGEWSECEPYTRENIAPEAVSKALDECLAFMRANEVLLIQALKTRNAEHLGHDFFLSRNGHGTGFFDRGTEPCWRRLQNSARQWGESDLYRGADDRFYF